MPASRTINVNNSTSIDAVISLVNGLVPGEKSYSLRADKGGINGSYTLFFRTGKETLWERLWNYIFREGQRNNAREAVIQIFKNLKQDRLIDESEFDSLISNIKEIKHLYQDEKLSTLLKSAKEKSENVAKDKSHELKKVSKFPVASGLGTVQHLLSQAHSKSFYNSYVAGDVIFGGSTSLKNVPCKKMEALDVADLHPSTSIVMRDSCDYFSMSNHCRIWLGAINDYAKKYMAVPSACQHAAVKLENGGIYYLARHREALLKTPLDETDFQYMEAVYSAALADAIKENRPILFTPLFDYDERTIERCVYAMLAPVQKFLKQGQQPKVEIRTTCPKIMAAIENAKLRHLSNVIPLDAIPNIQFKKKISIEDIESDGLIMLTSKTCQYAEGEVARKLSDAYVNFSTGEQAEKVGKRRLLSGASSRQFYFFAPLCTGQTNLTLNYDEVGEIYLEAFKKSKEQGCQCITLEVIFPFAKKENEAALMAMNAIRTARIAFPDLRVTLLGNDSNIEKHRRLLTLKTDMVPDRAQQ